MLGRGFETHKKTTGFQDFSEFSSLDKTYSSVEVR